jgi:hypothetical protein
VEADRIPLRRRTLLRHNMLLRSNTRQAVEAVLVATASRVMAAANRIVDRAEAHRIVGRAETRRLAVEAHKTVEREEMLRGLDRPAIAGLGKLAAIVPAKPVAIGPRRLAETVVDRLARTAVDRTPAIGAARLAAERRTPATVVVLELLDGISQPEARLSL